MKRIVLFALFFLVLSGCGSGRKEESVQPNPEPIPAVTSRKMDGALDRIMENAPESDAAGSAETASDGKSVPTITEIDLEDYFQEWNGCAVFYEPEEASYEIYRTDLAERRTSPCSTFKIVTSALGLEAGVIDPEDSMRIWSGVPYWREAWNRDMDFADAFRTSCVWYFRETVDELGEERMQEGLDRLDYGNRDCSEWDGRAARGLAERALSGFWIESSLQISPKEQTEVMAKIFGASPLCRKETQNTLREVMRLEETQAAVYGKTGLGKENGRTKDAWFVGVAEPEGRQICFAVWLGDSEIPADSTTAKEIALRLLKERYGIA